MNNHFRHIEEEYFKLRGQFSLGRITESEFDAALQELGIQDAQGRFWMIGANTGRWYYYDSENWVEGDPFEQQAPPPRKPESAREPEPSPVSKAKPAPASASTPHFLEQDVAPAPPSAARFAVPFLLIGVMLLALGVMAFLLLDGNLVRLVSANSVPTRVPPVTALALQPTTFALQPTFAPSLAASPTPTATRTRTAENGEIAVPISVTPPVFALEPTDTRPAVTTIPTITPGGSSPKDFVPDVDMAIMTATAQALGKQSPTPSSPDSANPADTSALNSNNTGTNPVDAPNPNPSNSVQPSPNNSGLAPDVYITGLQVSPHPPPQRREITFTATFLNTNPDPVGMEWRVVLLDPNKTSRNKDWGQSGLMGINVPPGTSQFSLAFVPVTGAGPCVTLQALVARTLPGRDRFYLPGTHGGPFATNFTFC